MKAAPSTWPVVATMAVSRTGVPASSEVAEVPPEKGVPVAAVRRTVTGPVPALWKPTPSVSSAASHEQKGRHRHHPAPGPDRAVPVILRLSASAYEIASCPSRQDHGIPAPPRRTWVNRRGRPGDT